jgi:tRNA-dihydrouridine synthase C
MLDPKTPALVLAPMDGITDAPMRALQGSTGAFTYTVSEFVRVSVQPIPRKVFVKEIPELLQGGVTPSGLPVQVQLLGGDPGRMAASAATACKAGAKGIDINFGCPAPTVNRHDGGASLLNHPCRIREIVAAIREAVPPEIPVSAKLRLGWDSIDCIHENAAMTAEGGASWLTIHARTRVQGYSPPVYWKPIGQVRAALGLPVIANGDIWSFEDFLRCREETGCIHFMLGRCALANPALPHQVARELGIGATGPIDIDWSSLFNRLVALIGDQPKLSLLRLKQWMKIAHLYGEFPYFHELKQTQTLEEFFEKLAFEASRDGAKASA